MVEDMFTVYFLGLAVIGAIISYGAILVWGFEHFPKTTTVITAIILTVVIFILAGMLLA